MRRFGEPRRRNRRHVLVAERSRNKTSVTLDLGTAAGATFSGNSSRGRMSLVENFRPGLLERWGLDYDGMRELNPRWSAACLRIRPRRSVPQQPGFARIAHVFAGLASLAGMRSRDPPLTPGSTSLADYVSGVYGVVGVLLALRARRRTGTGQCVDLALYETMFRMLDDLAPAYAAAAPSEIGRVPTRSTSARTATTHHGIAGSRSPARMTTCSSVSRGRWTGRISPNPPSMAPRRRGCAIPPKSTRLCRAGSAQ